MQGLCRDESVVELMNFITPRSSRPGSFWLEGSNVYEAPGVLDSRADRKATMSAMREEELFGE